MLRKIKVYGILLVLQAERCCYICSPSTENTMYICNGTNFEFSVDSQTSEMESFHIAHLILFA